MESNVASESSESKQTGGNSPLHARREQLHCGLLKRGRTGFDCWFEIQAACRGSLVGLVKLPGNT